VAAMDEIQAMAVPIAVAGSFQTEKPDPMRCAIDCSLLCDMHYGYRTYRGMIDAPDLELQDKNTAGLVAVAAALMKMCLARDSLIPALNPNIKVLMDNDFVLSNLEQLRSSGQPGTDGPNMHKLFTSECLKQVLSPIPKDGVDLLTQFSLT